MTDRVALVTGASRGIGRAIAERLARDGLVVVGTATGEEGAGVISGYLEEQGNPGTGMALRVEDAAAVAAVVESVGERFGPPAVLVNNAGITRDNLLLRMKEEEWAEVIDTNLTGAYHLCRACVRGMTRGRWGRIINITSVVGAMGNIGQSNYAASKAAAGGLSRALARELGSRGVTVNCVAPGFIDTDMSRALPEEQQEALRGQIPLGRLGEPEEVAELVAFLAGDHSAYITGETIHVNGGMYMS